MPTDHSPQDRLAGLAPVGPPEPRPGSAGRSAGASADQASSPEQSRRSRRWAPGADAADDGAPAVRARALAAATSAYAATYGHPLEHPTASGPVRWGTSTRTALLVAAALALVGGGVVVHTLAGAPAAVVVAKDVDPAAPVPPGAGGTDPEGAPPGSGATVTLPPGPGEARAALDEAPGTAGEDAPRLLVHVVGRVHEPGVVELPAGARVVDAVAAAGGATTEADLSALNLARPVVDGEQVLVPRPGELVPEPPGPPPGDVAAGAAAATAGGGLVDVNRAGPGELEALPGIGPVLAERIVADRQEHGPFASVDDLQRVRGIGPSLLADLRDRATA
nr:helix-hairpin-helix domain-containing protein [uncultured Actinotalea sp.]